MQHKIKIAAVQMDANPTPTADRLERAERLVADAARAGAELVVLPELFNTGYTFDESNHYRAEPLHGPTVTWMTKTAARFKIHLAGSLMLLDRPEVYNALLLLAPDGRMWRYDKIYPWGWERGYFCRGKDITVADTDLGCVGMMVCADVAHPELWKRYAGKIDLMLISSCPPDVGNPVFHLPGGDQVTFDQMGPVMALAKGAARRAFGDMLNEQTAWLGVPAVNTVGTGHIQTRIPNGTATLLTVLPLAPWLIKYLPQAGQMQMACDMVPGCKAVDARGRVLTELTQEQGEAFTMAEVTLAERRPRPSGAQPPSRWSFFVYLVSDVLLPWLSIPVYRRGLRRAWGKEMAPITTTLDHAAPARQWMGILGASAAISFLLGLLLGRRLATPER